MLNVYGEPEYRYRSFKLAEFSIHKIPKFAPFTGYPGLFKPMSWGFDTNSEAETWNVGILCLPLIYIPQPEDLAHKNMAG